MTDELKTSLLEVDCGVSLLLWEKETSVNVNCLSGCTYIFALNQFAQYQLKHCVMLSKPEHWPQAIAQYQSLWWPVTNSTFTHFSAIETVTT